MHTAPTYIHAVGTALPGPAVDNTELARHFGTDELWEQWVDLFIGTRTRHLATDLASGEPRFNLAELLATAASRAFETAKIAPGDIDLVVMGTATPDKLMPATVNMVTEILGINSVPAFQLQSGCTGAVQALEVADRLLSTGHYPTALVLGGDICSKIIDPTADINAMSPEEMVNIVLFGDAAGAAVLRTTPAEESVTLQRVMTRAEGLNRPPGQSLEWFTKAQSRTGVPAVTEDYKAIEESVPLMSIEVLKDLLDSTRWRSEDVDWLLPPQLSGRMTATIAEHLELPNAQQVNCVSETGNTSNALPFLQLERLFPKMTTGDRALGIAIESSKWIKSGFAIEKA